MAYSDFAASNKRALVILNEYSSNASRMHRQIEKLALPVKLVHTYKDVRLTRDAILAEARKGDVVFSAGGDGTTHQVAAILLSPEGRARNLHLLPFVPLRGGNANDVAVMINGHKSAAQILETGRQVELYPLEVRVGGTASQMHFVLGYFGIGVTAESSRRYESLKKSATPFKRVTGIQLAREVAATWSTLHTYEPFELQHGVGKTEMVASYLLLRGDRVAKLGRPHASLGETQFESLTTYPTGLSGALATMLRLQQGKLSGKMHTIKKFTIRSSDGLPLPVQYDGEFSRIDSGSELDVKIANVPYRTITTRL